MLSFIWSHESTVTTDFTLNALIWEMETGATLCPHLLSYLHPLIFNQLHLFSVRNISFYFYHTYSLFVSWITLDGRLCSGKLFMLFPLPPWLQLQQLVLFPCMLIILSSRTLLPTYPAAAAWYFSLLSHYVAIHLILQLFLISNEEISIIIIQYMLLVSLNN